MYFRGMSKTNKWALKAGRNTTYWPTRGEAEAMGEMEIAKGRATKYTVTKA